MESKGIETKTLPVFLLNSCAKYSKQDHLLQEEGTPSDGKLPKVEKTNLEKNFRYGNQ